MVATIDEESSLEVSHRNDTKAVVKNSASSTLPPKPNNKKRIHWNYKVVKRRHHRLCDLSDEEKEAVWYTANDTKIILAMAKVTVKMMMKGEICDDIDYCSRGLEGKTPSGAKRRQKNKQILRKALLEEQEIQREEGVYDPEYLAELSIFYSKDVCVAAYNTGLSDEHSVQEFVDVCNTDIAPMVPRRMKRA